MNGIRMVNVAELEQPYDGLRVRNVRSEARLLVSMQEAGQKTPLIVIAGSAAGRHAVVDGHKRLRAMKKLKCDAAQAVVWSVPAEEALAQIYRLQESGSWNALEEGALVEELHRGAKWTLQKIAEKLERTVSWASRRLGLIEELPESVVEAVREGKIGVYSAVMCLLPLSRDNKDLAERLAGKLKEGIFTSRQIRLLYEHCAKGPAAVAERIVSDPATFLKALEIPKGDVRLSSPQNKCLERLNTMGRVALSLVRDLPEVWPASSDALAHGVFTTTWRRCRERLAYLEKTVALQEGPQAVQSGTVHD
jgi:ParB/RepB/Spo0J family partition protein